MRRAFLPPELGPLVQKPPTQEPLIPKSGGRQSPPAPGRKNTHTVARAAGASRQVAVCRWESVWAVRSRPPGPNPLALNVALNEFQAGIRQCPPGACLPAVSRKALALNSSDSRAVDTKCGKQDLNLHGITTTRPSTWRVCQFRHSRSGANPNVLLDILSTTARFHTPRTAPHSEPSPTAVKQPSRDATKSAAANSQRHQTRPSRP